MVGTLVAEVPVDMERTFRELRKTPSDSESREREWNRHHDGSEFGWSDLLQSRRVLLVSEAGSGKTYECQQRALTLFDNGEPAFYLPLERVAAGGVAAILYGAQLQRYQEWIASSSQVAYFFLDSIDELQLVHGSFRDALSRLAHEFAGALGRTTIVVTSRPVAIDRRAFNEILPVPLAAPTTVIGDGAEFVRIAIQVPAEKEPEQLPAFREVELLPLTDKQIVEFAAERRVVSPQALLSAIDTKHARDFASRPQDLIELCDDWRDHREIRSHFEQIKSHVQARLAARLDRRERANLSVEKGRQGAQRLALAAILCRRLTVRYSAGADVEESGDAPLDPRAILPGWNANEIATLLERAVFSDGGYGRVRFHHRSVMEYLAACQIDQLIRSATISLSAAKRLLFGLTDTSAKLLKPSMRPIAGWLSLLRTDLFEAVLEVEPVTLLLHGDPESLTDPQRARALLSFVERYGKGLWRGINVPDIQIARLAQTALSGAVLSAWSSGIENPEVRRLLLKLISAGRFRNCADLAASIACDPASDDEERFDALIALSNLSDGRLGAFVGAAAAIAPGWTERIARWVGTFFYPENVSESQLLQLLTKIRVESRRRDSYADSIARVIEKADVSTTRLEGLLPGLLALTRATLEVKDDEIVDRPGRLDASTILRALSVRLLERGSQSTELFEASVLALRALEASTGLRKGGPELRTRLNSVPDHVRRQVFEADFACITMLNPKRSAQYRYVRLAYEGALSYTEKQDAQWALDALSEPAAPAERRAVLLHLTLNLAAFREREQQDVAAIGCAVADSAALTAHMNEALEASKPNETGIRLLAEQRKREERQHRKLASEREDWLNFWRRVAKQPALAFAPGRLDATIWNLWIVLRQKARGGEEGRWDRDFLERHFGQEVTNAVRKALMVYWRSMMPTVRSERTVGEASTYLMTWSIGLMGIYAEAEDPAWATKLDSNEAELAARYALLELGGLPAWLVALGESHASAVEQIVGDELWDELTDPSSKARWHSMLLQGLRHGHVALARLLQVRLIAWLGWPGEALMQLPYSESDENKLNQVISVLIAHCGPSVCGSLEELAARQVDASASDQFVFFWVPVLCCLSPVRGTEKLLDLLQGLPVQPDGVAVQAIGCLFSGRRAEGSVDWNTALTADLLLRLTIAIHHHVRPEDDLVHDGVYSPGSRDFAENGRSYVFNALMQASGTEGMRAKMALAAHPIFDHLRDRIAALAQERLAAEVDSSVAELPELAALLEGRELPPRTGADMAALLVDRLDDLQELMLRDTGPRALWAAVDDENTLRPAIAHEFEIAARNAYTVDQESVTVDGKETDIRLRSVSGHQATIELKVGEKSRSARVLRDTVEDQLVKKYMAHSMARSGCLLVTVSDQTKRWRHPETNVRIDRFKLQELLDEAAHAAQMRLGGEARVMARVLDLTPRLTTEVVASAKRVRRTR